MGDSDKAFAQTLLAWYDRSRRDLPWRLPRDSTATLDPYAVLVSEIMLQQTQVSTVIPYFHRFLEGFPTVADLAAANEQRVLRAWQGLGYYSRARNLQAAARRIVAEFEGRVPDSVESLRSLPGVGRYTAGAVASMAFGRRAAVVDGNVARVLCRLEKIEDDPRRPDVVKHLWDRAERMLPMDRVGDFNSAMMELGATLCTPRLPACPVCPVRDFCRAAATGAQESIPKARKSAATPLLRRWTICVVRNHRWLLEQRPAAGRWAGMWQFLTLEAGTGRPTAALVQRRVGLRVSKLRQIGKVRHALTHRRYIFDVFTASADGAASSIAGSGLRWMRMKEMDGYPLPRPQTRILEMLLALEED